MAIKAIHRLFGHSRLARLTVSLFALGTIAALPEITISANALWLRSPQIAAGSLIGSQIFLLFFVIPVLAIASRGLKLQTSVQNMSLGLTLLLALVPLLGLFNQSLEIREALVILALYVVFVATFFRQGNVVDYIKHRFQLPTQARPIFSVFSLLAALALLLVASNSLVRQIIELSAWLSIPRFLLSLLLLPIGTNLPEMILAWQGIKRGDNEFAVGDFLGSITINSLVLVVVTLLSKTEIAVGLTINPLIWLFAAGLVVFGIFCYSRKMLSLGESLILLLFYLAMASAAWWLGYGRLLE